MRKIWQILYNTAIGFYEDGCNQRAAALTFFTLMSIVPVMAVALGLARGFGFAPLLENVVKEQLSEQADIAKYLIEFAYTLLERTSGGVIAGIGVLLLLWSVYNIFGNVEEALNHIWKVPNPRSWIRKITDYIAAMIICPLIFVVSSSLTIYLKTYFTDVSHYALFLEKTFFYLSPYLLTWILFTFLYFFLPNRGIPFKYGMIGVLVGGTAYQLLQTFYITLQLKLSSYGAVYGSFAALPLFLIWLNLSWMIVLAGAELAYQTEVYAWADTPLHKHFPHVVTSKRVLALMIVHVIIRGFCEQKEPYTLHRLSDKFGSSKKALDEIITVLTKYKILSETAYEADSETHYQPARDVNTITLKTIVDLFPDIKSDYVELYKNPLVTYFEEKLGQFEEAVIQEPPNMSLNNPIHTETHQA